MNYFLMKGGKGSGRPLGSKNKVGGKKEEGEPKNNGEASSEEGGKKPTNEVSSVANTATKKPTKNGAVNTDLNRLKKMKMDSPANIRKARGMVDRILKNKQATPKQFEKAKKYSALLKPYEDQFN